MYLEVAEHGLDLLDSIGVLAKARLADDGHAGVVADALQLLSEVAQRLLVASALLGEAGDGPQLDLDAGVELLAAHVPDALVGQDGDLGAAAVLNLGRGEDAALDVGHLVVDGDAEVLDVRVVVEAGAQHQVVDLLLAVGRRTSRRFDHRRRLHVGELLDAALARHYVAHLERQVRVLLLLAHLQARQVRISTFKESNVSFISSSFLFA